mgnify:CR=1 FL=1|jgi:hypothetical protein
MYNEKCTIKEIVHNYSLFIFNYSLALGSIGQFIHKIHNLQNYQKPAIIRDICYLGVLKFLTDPALLQSQ